MINSNETDFHLLMDGYSVKPRILLADDNVAARRLVAALLRHMGFTVDTASDGEEALIRVQHSIYQIIILDIDMPGMDGLTTARHIRSMAGRRSRARIIAMSGYLNDFKTQQDWSELFDASIPKPVTKFRLQDSIHRVLQGK